MAHIFPHWSMRTLYNNVGQWFGPAPPPPPPPPSEHKKSLCFPSSPIVKQKNLFLEKSETTSQSLLHKNVNNCALVLKKSKINLRGTVATVLFLQHSVICLIIEPKWNM